MNDAAAFECAGKHKRACASGDCGHFVKKSRILQESAEAAEEVEEAAESSCITARSIDVCGDDQADSSTSKRCEGFFYYEQGEWKNFSMEATEYLSRSLADGKEWDVWDSIYMVNFVLMTQMNLRTGYRRSISWIDQNGTKHTPSVPFEGSWEGNSASGLQLPGDSLAFFSNHDPYAGGRQAGSKNQTSDLTKVFDDMIVKLEESSQEHQYVKAKFLCGLGVFEPGAVVKAIYKNRHSTTSGKSRKLAFEQHLAMMKERQIDPNVQFGWHGTSKEGIIGIILHGFGQWKASNSGLNYGTGLYLSPENCSHVSAVHSDIDEIGQQHIVFCRVILGRSELVPQGSTQFHPSSDAYDTGVDDLSHPRRYIVWSTHMNTHVLPLYIVSFKLSPQSPEKLPEKQSWDGRQDSERVVLPEQPVCRGDRNRSFKLPRSPYIPLRQLIPALRRSIPAAKMQIILQHHASFKAGQLSRDMMLRKLKHVAGEKVLHDLMTYPPLVSGEAWSREKRQ